MCQIISTLRLGENSLPPTISTAEAEEEEIYKVEFFAAVISIEERQRHCCRSSAFACAPAPTALFYRRGGRGRRDALTLFFRRGYFASRRESGGERGEGGEGTLGTAKVRRS